MKNPKGSISLPNLSLSMTDGQPAFLNAQEKSGHNGLWRRSQSYMRAIDKSNPVNDFKLLPHWKRNESYVNMAHFSATEDVEQEVPKDNERKKESSFKKLMRRLFSCCHLQREPTEMGYPEEEDEELLFFLNFYCSLLIPEVQSTVTVMTVALMMKPLVCCLHPTGFMATSMTMKKASCIPLQSLNKAFLYQKWGYIKYFGLIWMLNAEENSVDVEVNDNLTKGGTQNSIVTIFSMWNTMMGTSLLSMPWAIKQAGFVNGIVLLLMMAGIMTYTSYRVITSGRSIAEAVISEFSDVVRVYLGKVAEAIALFCSIVTFLGGAIVYWILMSNFLYHIVIFIYSHIHDETAVSNNSSVNHDYDDAICQNQTDVLILPASLTRVWDETYTVPLFLVILVFPLINFKSPTFFTKFNSFGTLSVTYLLIFVSVKAAKWGFHLEMSSEDSGRPYFTENFKWSFPALTGVAALAYFLQNAVMAIVRNQKHPENNTRDLIIAYCLVCFTYTFMGAIFYASFPLDKSCIADNLLNNMTSNDIMSFAARVSLFFQMTCVLPLILYVMRTQLLQFLFSSIWPSLKHVLILNILIITICILFAVFMPNIGHIISFVGAFCGVSYAIALPCIVYIVASYRHGTLSRIKLVFHCILIILGVANFIAQFVLIGHTS